MFRDLCMMHLSDSADDEGDDESRAPAREGVADAEDGPGEVGRQVQVRGKVAGGQGAVEKEACKSKSNHTTTNF